MADHHAPHPDTTASSSTGLRGTLHQRGLRMTPQRQMVLDAVRALGHATPESVCTHVQRTAPAVNISTVYRTLDLLEDIGVVRHTHLGHGAPTYSADGHPHVHLVCHRCERVTEIDPALLVPLASALQDGHGFRLDPAHLALSGLCAACAAAPDREDHP
ncbi:transcriptional repressor [Rhodococcus antarcticus]|uniref:Transcriptional repressor n=1 Tax=Rhodococcus antarcticus TaxID=2987751 RepID=A0ABY6P1J1_9NOCA|nr:Fur family transcriptional regulator [Rhodococcus antarcticus]UZJ25078.1 transcriptional repressor [Rhodococcus antarcticus]